MSKKLLYIGNKPSQSSGTVTTIETLSLLLASEGFDVITASAAKNKAHRLLDMLATTFKYRNKVDYVLIDTYSTLNFTYAVAVAYLCRKFKIPYIPILHGGDLLSRLLISPKASAKLFGNAYTNVSPSHYLMRAFKKAGFSNITYLPNTIEIANYPFLLRKEIKPKLLWVRSFAEIYNPILALKVLKNLKDNGQEASLCMIGPFKDKSIDQCRQFNETHNLGAEFTGKLEKEAWIERSTAFDIFINTTNFDNTPVSVMEAMALGLPIVSTDVGGMPYLIESGTDGILVPPDNEDAFVEAIEKLIMQPELAIDMAEKARFKVENFDWQHVKHSWHSLLNN